MEGVRKVPGSQHVRRALLCGLLARRWLSNSKLFENQSWTAVEYAVLSVAIVVRGDLGPEAFIHEICIPAATAIRCPSIKHWLGSSLVVKSQFIWLWDNPSVQPILRASLEPDRHEGCLPS